MTVRVLTLYATSLVLSACAVEPVDLSLIFEGTVTAREPLNGADTVPAMLVEAGPGGLADPLCANAAVFFLRDVTWLAFANGAPARLDDLSVDARVRVWWDGSQLDSCPPKRRADKVTILS